MAAVGAYVGKRLGGSVETVGLLDLLSLITVGDRDGDIVGSSVKTVGEDVGDNVGDKVGDKVSFNVGCGVVGARVRTGLPTDQVTLLDSASHPVVVMTSTVLDVDVLSSS